MPCNCLHEMIVPLAEKCNVHVEDVEIDNEMLIPANRLFITASIKTPGKKKKKSVTVVLSYCGFCGKPYEDSVG